jgi:hypothetical protein
MADCPAIEADVAAARVLRNADAMITKALRTP